MPSGKFESLKDFDLGVRGSVAAFFAPGEGVLMSPVIPELIRRL